MTRLVCHQVQGRGVVDDPKIGVLSHVNREHADDIHLHDFIELLRCLYFGLNGPRRWLVAEAPRAAQALNALLHLLA